MRILDFIYKRYKPENKLRLISEMSNSDLEAVTEEQIQLLLMDAGERCEGHKKVNGKYVYFKTHRGCLTFCDNLAPGNEYNSTVDEIYEDKNHKIQFSLYIQGDDIDTDTECSYTTARDSLRYTNNSWGSLHESFRNGYKHDVPANYDANDYRNVIRSLLYQSVLTKYKLKYSDYFTGCNHGYQHKPVELKKEFQTKDNTKEYTIYKTKLVTEKAVIKAKTEKEALEKARDSFSGVSWNWSSNEVKYKAEKNGD